MTTLTIITMVFETSMTIASDSSPPPDDRRFITALQSTLRTLPKFIFYLRSPKVTCTFGDIGAVCFIYIYLELCFTIPRAGYLFYFSLSII